MSWMDAGITAAASHFNTLFNGLMGNYQIKKNFQYQQKLAEQQYGYQSALMDKQNQQNIDMFNRTNEYNLPYNEVQRLQDAGLNPAFMFGQTTPASAVNGAAPSYSSPGVPNIESPWHSDLDLSGSFDRAIEQQKVDNERQRTKNEFEEIKSRIKVNDSIIPLNETIKDLNENQIDLIKSEIANNEVKRSEMNKNIDLMEESIRSQLVQQDYYKTMAENDRKNAETARINAMTNRMLANATIKMNELYAKKVEKEIEMTKEQLKQLVIQTKLSKNQLVRDSIDTKWHGKNVKINYEIEQGKAKILTIQGDVLDATEVAQIGRAYVGLVNDACVTIGNGASAVSKTVKAAADVSTMGATSVVGNNETTPLINAPDNFTGSSIAPWF